MAYHDSSSRARSGPVILGLFTAPPHIDLIALKLEDLSAAEFNELSISFNLKPEFIAPLKPNEFTASLKLADFPIQPDQIVLGEVQKWIQEYENSISNSAMASSSTITKRPWDVYYAQGTISDDDVAFAIAKNMMTVYSSCDFAHSARLREIFSAGGRGFMNQKCANLIAYQLHVDGVKRKNVSDEELQALSELRREKANAYHSDISSSSSSEYDSSSPSSSDARPPSISPSPSPSSPSPTPSPSPSSPSASVSRNSPEDIINFKPLNQKPSFRFQPSSFGASLPSFLEEMKKSNEALATGNADDKKIELSDSDEQDHIEMNLNLGVLEETKPDTITPALSSPTNLKRKASSNDAAPNTTPAKKLKIRLIHKKKTSADSSSSSDGSSAASNSSPPLKIRLIHRAGNTPPKAVAKKAIKKKSDEKKMTAKIIKKEKKEKKEGPMVKKITIKLTIKKKPEAVGVDLDQSQTVEVDTDCDWSSVMGYDPDQETEPFPAYVEPSMEELEAFTNSIFSTVGSGELPGYSVVHVHND